MRRAEFTDVLAPLGFAPLTEPTKSSLWFGRKRAAGWTDAFAIELNARSGGSPNIFFGIENDSLRKSVLNIASAISPKAFTEQKRRFFDLTQIPCLVTFPAPSQRTIDRDFLADVKKIGCEFALITNSYFDVSSDSRFLGFLKRSDDVFGNYTSPFRIIYIGVLLHREKQTPEDFVHQCITIPARILECHILLHAEQYSSEVFLNKCVNEIWKL